MGAKYVEHLTRDDDLPQPTVSNAHVFVFGNLQAALRLRLRLHGVNHNKPSPMAVGGMQGAPGAVAVDLWGL